VSLNLRADSLAGFHSRKGNHAESQSHQSEQAFRVTSTSGARKKERGYTRKAPGSEDAVTAKTQWARHSYASVLHDSSLARISGSAKCSKHSAKPNKSEPRWRWLEMLERIIAVFSRPKITPIVVKRRSRIPVVILRESSIRTERAIPVFGRMA